MFNIHKAKRHTDDNADLRTISVIFMYFLFDIFKYDKPEDEDLHHSKLVQGFYKYCKENDIWIADNRTDLLYYNDLIANGDITKYNAVQLSNILKHNNSYKFLKEFTHNFFWYIHYYYIPDLNDTLLDMTRDYKIYLKLNIQNKAFIDLYDKFFIPFITNQVSLNDIENYIKKYNYEP